MTIAGTAGLRRINELRWAGRPIWLLVLAAIGGALLVIVATTRWAVPSDEHAYWLAARRIIDGLPLYDPAATIITPYAYLYPPPLAQAMVPVALVLPSWAFSALWTIGMGIALWWLAGRDVIRALALIAFLPVAVEFWFRNVHLFLAVLIVLGLRGHPWTMSIGAAIKVSPGLGLVWFAGRGRWRDATIMLVSGLAILVVSVVLAPDQWLAWIDYLRAQDPFAQSAFFGVPFPIRAVVALALTVIASRIDGWRGEVLLVVAITLALPSLWFTGMSLLVAAVPLYRERDRGGTVATTAHPGEDRVGGTGDGQDGVEQATGRVEQDADPVEPEQPERDR